MNDITIDRFCNETIKVRQPAVGFRASVDSFLLARSVDIFDGATLLDVGSGVGTASICAVYSTPRVQVTALELDKEISQLCQANYRDNNIEATVICDDVVSNPLKGERFDFVITNPPFFKYGSGRKSASKLHANHETVPLDSWISFCLKRLKPKGVFSIIHMTDRLQDILSALNSSVGGIKVTPICFKSGELPARVVVTARNASSKRLILNNPVTITSRNAYNELTPSLFL